MRENMFRFLKSTIMLCVRFPLDFRLRSVKLGSA